MPATDHDWNKPAAMAIPRPGDIVMVDSTNFTTLFGGTDSLVSFWLNVALMRASD
jgi:hypothetical protein